jgi:hypothetical protein
MEPKLICAVALSGLVQLVSTGAAAHALTFAECIEGGKFIRNAALAREGGVSREFFVNKFIEDLALIQSFPPQLRWFVQDAEDEQLLSAAVFQVFDAPQPPLRHEAMFVNVCLQAGASGEN